jgi:hypothetical protein
LSLAKEKGAAPIMNQMFTVTGEMLHKRPEMVADGYKVGDEVPGKLLHAKYSRYMQQLGREEPELIAELIKPAHASPTTVPLRRQALFHCRWPIMPATALSRALRIIIRAT